MSIHKSPWYRRFTRIYAGTLSMARFDAILKRAKARREAGE